MIIKTGMRTLQTTHYPIYADPDFDRLNSFLREADYSKFFFLVDRNTSEHCLPLVQLHLELSDNYDIIEIDAGEENKNIDICIGIWRTLLDFEADRKSLLINLGGGMITDIGGFAASTYKRGIDFIHIPTSLLAQVDASIGGKNGIDLDHLKNMVGTFSNPKAIFIQPEFLQTLAPREMLAGYAEMLKHGLISDAAYFEKLRETNPAGLEFMEETTDLIFRSVEIKNKMVEQDPFEKNIRKLLNFGHTIGHALESFSLMHDEKPLLHGEAILAGMVAESFLSHKKLQLPLSDLEKIKNYISSLPFHFSLKKSDFQECFDLIKKDKKNSDAGINFTLLESIGAARIDHFCSQNEIAEAFEFMLLLNADNRHNNLPLL